MKHLQARHWPKALLWFCLFQKLPTFHTFFFFTPSTFSHVIADFTCNSQYLSILNLYLGALLPLAQVWSMEYAPKLPAKSWLTRSCLCECVFPPPHTHMSPSRYTSETCQQVIIFYADGSELLGAFQLCFTLQALLPFPLAAVPDSRSPGAADLLSPFSHVSSCPYKERLP